MAVEHLKLPVQHLVDAHHHIRTEGGVLEPVSKVHDHGHLLHGRHLGAEVGHDEQIGGVLHQQRAVAVVGVVVVGAAAEEHVGVELADLPDHALAGLQIGHKLAVGDVPHVVGDPGQLGQGLSLAIAASGDLGGLHGLMAAAAVEGGDELDRVTGLDKLQRRAAAAELAVIGVRPDHENTQFSIHSDQPSFFGFYSVKPL